ncbi:MAG: hypothetical protein HZA91_09680 [Verrucomicrobia bacterium]|nr:hypothetical protein [Verrucomicrobiota bacterium]
MRKLLLPVLFLALAWGLAQLFLLRFEAGDVYPPYSSLRTDPLGVKVLHDSLAGLGGLAVGRNHQPPDRLADRGPLTLFWLGCDEDDLGLVTENFARGLEAVAARGGRLVMTFEPVNRSAPEPKKVSKKKDSTKDGKKKDESKRKKRSRIEEELKLVSLRERWGLRTTHARLPRNRDDVTKPAEATLQTKDELPPEVSWHTSLYFTDLGKPWRVVYSRDGRAVVIERPFGRGTLVLASDSYLLSNEAMAEERQPALLAWLAGANREVLFDESHFGVREDRGVMTLARQYRLHGLLAGLLALAALFVWQSMARFVPPRECEDEAGVGAGMAGRDSTAGLVNLVRRSIPPGELVAACFEEWKKSFAHRKDLAPKVARAQTVVAAERALPAVRRQPVRAYREICGIFAERK